MRTSDLAYSAALAAALLACRSSTPSRGAEAPPAARRENVADELFGIRVPDPYRWMETPGDPEFLSWLRAQGAYTARQLGALPERATLHARIRALGNGSSGIDGPQLAGGRTFYLFMAPGEPLAKLLVRDADGTQRVLADPTVLGAGRMDSHVSIDSFRAAPDGTLVAYGLAGGGGEVTTIHVLEVDSGRELPDRAERIWGEFAAAWLPDSTGFFYTQMAPPADGVDPLFDMRVRLHRLGTPGESDPLILGRGVGTTMSFEPQEFPSLEVPRGTTWLVASGGGARSETRFAVAPLGALDASGAGMTPWRKVADYDDEIEALGIHGDRLYLLSRKDAPNRRLLSVPARDPDLATARIEVPEDPLAVIETLSIAREAVYFRELLVGRGRIRRAGFADGSPSTLATSAIVPLPFEGSVDALATDPAQAGATIQLQGWNRPAQQFALDPASGLAFRPTGVQATALADLDALVAEELEAPSFDGERVPLSILRSRTFAADGSHPTILLGYGAYGISLPPHFSPTLLAWIERGGVLAVSHTRGGGEKGYRWQAAGSHEHKLNGVRDFIACAEFLVAHGYTTSARLAAMGGSAGGILIGRAITERPDLFAAANIQVGILNPLRMLHAENGANQIAELGDPRTADGFRSILAMDTYQHVQDGVAYPAILFTIGLNDGRVAPWNTGKAAARLQAASASGRPVLVRLDEDGGHGIGSSREQAFAERADVWSFFLAQFR